ncbi:MAG: TRAP-type uncharacterized transport system fused permease subunit, partial [Psychrobacter okhotskensis]
MNSQVMDHNNVTTMSDNHINNDSDSPIHSHPDVETNVDAELEAQAHNKAILEKYDRESITRHITQGPVKYFIAAICIFYSLFHLYITFNPMPALLQRSVHVGIGFALIFLIFPASKKSSRQRVAWYDWLWFVFSLSGMAYLIYE